MTAPAADPARRERDRSSRELADLARAGYLALRQPLMEVIFEVHHVADRPGYLIDHLRSSAAPFAGAQADPFAETLTSSANGLGLVVVTHTGFSAREGRNPGRERSVTEDERRRIFRGTATPNPNFIYESAWRFEGLICVDQSSIRVREWHCQAIKDIIFTIADMAKQVEAPIISLQAPAQVPFDDSEAAFETAAAEERALPPAASLAVRFAIALPQPKTVAILSFADQLASYSRAHGLGFWLRDTRPGSRQGNWRQLARPDFSRTSALFMERGDQAFVRVCLPLTMVGPARTGATLSALSLLRRHRLGVAACSVVALDDLLFINLQMTFTGVPDGPVLGLNDLLDPRRAAALPPAKALSHILDGLAGDHRALGAQSDDALSALTADYQCLIGPPRSLAAHALNDRMALWFCWQAHGCGLAPPLNAFFDALADVGLVRRRPGPDRWKNAPNIEYLVCRNMGNSILRGRGKLSVPREPALSRYPAGQARSRPTALCVAIERAWRGQTARHPDHAVRELTVAWRENWLGHWSLPL